jgi:hypothetical protein
MPAQTFEKYASYYILEKGGRLPPLRRPGNRQPPRNNPHLVNPRARENSQRASRPAQTLHRRTPPPQSPLHTNFFNNFQARCSSSSGVDLIPRQARQKRKCRSPSEEGPLAQPRSVKKEWARQASTLSSTWSSCVSLPHISQHPALFIGL